MKATADVMPRLLTVTEFAELLGRSVPSTHRFIVERLAPSPDSPVVYLSPHVKRIRMDAWLAWLDARTGQPAPVTERERRRRVNATRQLRQYQPATRRPRFDTRSPDEILADVASGKDRTEP